MTNRGDACNGPQFHGESPKNKHMDEFRFGRLSTGLDRYAHGLHLYRLMQNA